MGRRAVTSGNANRTAAGRSLRIAGRSVPDAGLSVRSDLASGLPAPAGEPPSLPRRLARVVRRPARSPHQTGGAKPRRAFGYAGSASSESAEAARASSRSWDRSEEHTSELQSLMRSSYAVFRLNKHKSKNNETTTSRQRID